MAIHRRILQCTLGIFTIMLWVVIPQIALAAPDLISYQGRLTDTADVSVTDSTYAVIFAVYADSVGGTPLWAENDSVSTHDGFFTHMLGSVTSLPQSIFQDNDRLYLEVDVEGETVLPRTRLASVPYAQRAGNLNVRDTNDSVVIKTFPDSHQLSIFGYGGEAAFILRGGVIGDEAAVLPDSSVNSIEMLDEPGIAVNTSASLISLATGVMTDLVTVDITTPSDGYIVLHGKCYILLSGTTGPNTALVQVDENEGGSPRFPYYTEAGLGGYVNTSDNYFPVYVTRTYYKPAGTYMFRMEGQASYPLPAEAKTWDHILTAVYYPTSYEAVKQISSEPGDYPQAVPITFNKSHDTSHTGTYYEVDLRYYEQKAKTARKALREAEAELEKAKQDTSR